MKSYLKTKDYAVTGEEFELLYDESLKMLVTEPKPLDLSKYYKSENYISHSDANTSLLEKIYQFVKKYSLKKKVRLINTYGTDEKTLLDVGAGTGDFLFTAKKSGWKIAGVEPNANAKLRARDKGIELFPSLDSLPEKQYNVITLWHVLEHLPNLDDQIKHIVSLLKENGTLVIAVPNFKSYDAKYKTGSQNYFRSFVVGLLSNVKAWSSKEYSSHIYILKSS